ncbi:hypothetical protein D0T57_08995 [Dysgonomonas sp. 511]|nr:hypothetical protein [Dysgonomonas sp. 511]
MSLLLTLCTVLIVGGGYPSGDKYISCFVDPYSNNIEFYWKDKNGENLGDFSRLKEFVEAEGRALVFAANGGMFAPDYSPQGLYIESYKVMSPLDTIQGYGNFYLKPNGVFYIKENGAPAICPTGNFVNDGKVKYATQSGPMLVIDGQIHPAFKNGSANLNIRNGVGVFPDGQLVFVMSKEKVNFYDFADYFLSLGCSNALYLDGYVSRTYFPAKDWVQTDGKFGVMIAITR